MNILKWSDVLAHNSPPQHCTTPGTHHHPQVWSVNYVPPGFVTKLPAG